MATKIDLLIKNANVFNSYIKEFIPGNIAVLEGKVFYVDESKSENFDSKNIVDVQGKYVMPGLIDIHMHIESSMVTPGSFCDYMAKCGVTTIVAESHEIGNVKGIDAVLEMIKASKQSPIDVFFGIPSSVPSTTSELETTGGKIDFEDMKVLLEQKEIICLGEVMNYKEIIKENDLEVTKFIKYLNENYPNFPIEGHCPSLTGLELAKYIYTGIDSDHTEHTLDEFIDRFKQGMFVQIQEKSLSVNLFNYIFENSLFEHCAFVTDDVMTDKLYRNGHLDDVVRKAIQIGFPIEKAIYCSTYTPARRMKLTDRGAISPGKLADFVILDDLINLEINSVYKNGELIFNKDNEDIKTKKHYKFSEEYYNSVNLEKISPSDLEIFTDKTDGKVRVRLMVVSDGTTRIAEEIGEVSIKDGKIDWENTEYILGVVFDRYGLTGNKSFALLKGDCIKTGAVATTWFHDSHNLFAMGKDIPSLIAAINTVIEQQGGFVVAKNGEILGNLELPVGGIMSDETVKDVAEKLEKVRNALINQGYNHYNPIMSIGTLGLAVSPFLKLTDVGLVDVPNGKIVDLIVE
ncbi:MAG: adenine deaminase [Tissierellia bacterium]|nr:adenine deaminase [Tissierellia bacterium]